MSLSNTQGNKTIISSNLSNLNLMSDEDRKRLKKAQIQQEDIPGIDEQENPGQTAAINAFLQQNATVDPETATSAWELLNIMRENAELNIYDQNTLRVAADMVDMGL